MTDTLARLADAVQERYRIEREVGQGGMATVYLAHDLRHNRKVALKVLAAELAALIGAERFLKEMEVTANLKDPHILPLFDSGVAQGPDGSRFLCYVMPYVEGETLRTRLQREKQLGVDEAVEQTEIFYTTATGSFMSVEIRTAPTITVGRHRVPYSSGPNPQFDISPDDQRTLRIWAGAGADSARTQLVLVQNFLAELRASR